MKNKFIYFAVIAALGFASCEPEFDKEVNNGSYSAGEADFTSYVAIGNSLTAGYMDGTVSRMSQANSYPNILAKQFAVVGGGLFEQPDFSMDVNNLGGLELGGNPIANTRLVIDASQGRPEPIAGVTAIEVSALQAKAYNNMGVPGAKSFHLLAPGYGNLAGVALGAANPYFVRHATTPSATVLGDAMTKNPTFFTNWIGSNDVLAYATSGGSGVDQNSTGNLDPSTYGGNDITNVNVFASVYSTIINTLTSNGAKGVVSTIPYVTSIPYFTTVPYNPLTPAKLGGSANISALNAQLYGPLNAIFSAYGEPNRVHLLSATAANPLLIKDVDAIDRSAEITGALTLQGYPAATAAAFGNIFGKARQATANDLVVLTAASVIGTTNAGAPAPVNINGVSYPLANQWVLSEIEQISVTSATDSFNNTIRSIAASKGLAVADMNAIMQQLVQGLRVADGQIYTANYFYNSNGMNNISTVLFSLDGVHPNARGYAVIANEILKVINTHYKAKLPLVVAGNYPGITILPSN